MKEKTLQDIFLRIAKGKGEMFVNYTGFRRFTYSYPQIRKLCYQMITLLDKHKVKKGDKVMIWGYNGPEWIVAFWGCVLRGAIVVPHDFRAGVSLGKKIISDAGVKLVIQSNTRPAIHKKTIYLERLFGELTDLKEGKVSKVKPSSTAEIVYTSGTTGNPKGVVLTHRNISTNLAQLRSVFSQGKMRFLSLLPLSHMFEQMIGMIFPLYHHGNVVYLKMLTKPSIKEAIKNEPIECIVLVPRLLEMILFSRKIPFVDNALVRALPLWKRKFLFGKVHLILGKQFKYFVVGGAPLSSKIEERVDTLGLELLQGYGLTETGPVVTCNIPGKKKKGSVGRPLPGVSVKFVKDEIFVKGNNVFAGYYKDKKKTSDALSGGWFKTGDLGKLDKGYLKLLGRRKDMIVLSSGLNVYPQDLEGVVTQLPEIKDCVVLGIPTTKGEVPIGVVLLNKKADPRKLLQKANQLISGALLEDLIIWPFPDFPRTPTLKAKRYQMIQYLQQHKQTKAVTAGGDVVAQILSTLTSKRISTSSRLERDLGLSSLDRLELVGRIQEATGVELPEEQITGQLRVRDLKHLIKKHKKIRHTYSKWGRNFLTKSLRWLGLHGLIFPIVRHYCDTTVKGFENVRNLKEPVIFVCNHQSHFDVPLLYSILPQYMRITPAAWAEYFEREGVSRLYGRLAYVFATLFFNIYKFPQKTRFRKAMQHTGKLLDSGWNIMLFPEGSRSMTEQFLPFQKGIGFIAREMNVAVVPMRIRGNVKLLPKTKHWPQRGKVSVHIGKPLRFNDGSVVDITKAVEKAMRKL